METSGWHDFVVDHFNEYREWERVNVEMMTELVSAVDKHGIERTPLNPNMGLEHAFVILSEEIGEVARALTYDGGGDTEQLIKELTQVATMAAAMVVGIRLAQGGV